MEIRGEPGNVTVNIFMNTPKKGSAGDHYTPSTEKRRKRQIGGEEKIEEQASTYHFKEALNEAVASDHGVPQVNHSRKIFEAHEGNADYFQMTERTKGIVVIINNEFAHNKNTRVGSRKDVSSLLASFEKIGRCEIIQYSNRSVQDIKDYLKEMVKSKTKTSFYAVVLMSHGTSKGDMDIFIGNDGSRIDVKEIVDIFKVDHLKEIPVLIFFQACRGKHVGQAEYRDPEQVDYEDEGDIDELDSIELDRRVTQSVQRLLPKCHFIGDPPSEDDEADAVVSYNDDEEDLDIKKYPRGIPNMLVSYSAAQGDASLRSRKTGAWFIQALCENLNEAERSGIDLLQIMTRVHIDVDKRRSTTAKYKDHKFAARTGYTLKKKLVFFHGI